MERRVTTNQNTDEAYAITSAMIQYGGGFVQALGRLYRYADETNQAKLAAAFPEYFAEYRAIAADMARRRA
jgi:hypothetical protein